MLRSVFALEGLRFVSVKNQEMTQVQSLAGSSNKKNDFHFENPKVGTTPQASGTCSQLIKEL